MDRDRLWDILAAALSANPNLLKAVQGLCVGLRVKLAINSSFQAIRVNIDVK